MVKTQQSPSLPLRELLYQNLLRLPTLCSNAGDVLHQLYFVIGNGYDWKDGRLVEDSVCYNEYTGGESFEAYLERMNSTTPESFGPGLRGLDDDDYDAYLNTGRSLTELARADVERDGLKAFHHHKENMDSLLKDFSIPKNKLYPLCPKYARFFTVPDDVKDDYLLGAIVSSASYVSALADDIITPGRSIPTPDEMGQLLDQQRKLQALAKERDLKGDEIR
jgi:hypothetical protein